MDHSLYSPYFRRGSCPDVKHLLEYDVTQINSIMECCGNTRLHHLVSMGLQEETLQLLKKGGDVSVKDNRGQTTLHIAVRNNFQYLDVILATESGKTAVNIPDEQENYPLHMATKQRNIDLVKLLLDNGAVVNCKNKYDVTPLHFATENEKISQSIFSLLIERGASPNVQDSRGMTPLHHAVENCNKDMVQLLLENGAEVDRKNMCGETPLQISTRKSYDTAQVLISTNLLAKGASPNVGAITPLIYAVQNKCIELVQILLENGAEVNSKNQEGETPLHIISSSINGTDLEKLICRTLLANGALVNVEDDDEMTPLHYAVERHSLDIVELLLENGAEVNCENKNGETPLHRTTRRTRNKNPSMQEETCTTLLANGALVNAEDVCGNTPLHCALYYNSINIVKLLLENGAELNCKNKNGGTPLHIVTRQFCDTYLSLKEFNSVQESTCSTILALGATPNVQDIYGMTPLHNAVENSSTSVVELLLDYGADVNSKNNKGETPLRYVQSVDTLDLLIQKVARIDEQDNCGRTELHHLAKYAKRYDRKFHFDFSNTCKKVLKLLEWGASPNIRDHFGKIPFDYYSFKNVQEEYEIKKSCLYSTNNVKRDVQNPSNIQKIKNECRKEVDRMNLELCRNNSLYDIFIQYNDPTFLYNEELESSVLSRDLKVRFPLYYSLLTSTYLRSRERVQLFDRVADILQTPLPFEVMRYILTFVDDDSLRNVIKAKEESPFYKELDFTLSKSDTESETESETDSDYEYDGPEDPGPEFNLGSD